MYGYHTWMSTGSNGRLLCMTGRVAMLHVIIKMPDHLFFFLTAAYLYLSMTVQADGGFSKTHVLLLQVSGNSWRELGGEGSIGPQGGGGLRAFCALPIFQPCMNG